MVLIPRVYTTCICWDVGIWFPHLELRGHTNPGLSRCRMFGLASDDCTVCVGRGPGEILIEFIGHAHWVSSVVFSPDGYHFE